jgi:lipopolysaccharide transport system ATP-binding protein
MRYLRAFQNNGGTILFVSHDTSAVVGLCEKAILLSRSSDARLIVGGAKEICQIYVKQLYSERTQVGAIDSQQINTETTNLAIAQKNNDSTRRFLAGGEQPENTISVTCFRHDAESFGRGGAKIIDVWFEDETKSRVSTVIGGNPVNFCIKVKSLKNIQWPAFGFTIKNSLGQYVFSEGTDLAFRQHTLTIANGDIWLVKFSFLMPIFIQGEYSINVAVAAGIGDDHIQHHWIEDVMTLYSMNSRLVQGICGLQNLSIGIEIYPGNRVL